MLKKTCLSLAVLLPSIASAAPMAPSEADVAHHFSTSVQADFTLLADSVDPALVYYVPNTGGVTINAKQSIQPVPSFQVYEYYPTFGFFAGEALTRLGGSFDTTSNQDSLGRLESEAAAKGLKLTPAPATTATTKFLLGPYLLEDERLDVDCIYDTYEIVTSSGELREVRVPVCSIDEGADYDIDTNIMYKFSQLPALSGSTVSQNIPFAGVTMPNVGQQLRPIMMSGGQWSGVVSAKVDWEIKANTQTRQARALINWEQTFEQASAFMAIHNNACVDIEMQAFYQNLASCDNADDCGVKIEYMNEFGQWTDVAPDDPEFINQVTAFQSTVENELFNQVDAYTTSTLGQVSTRATAFYTLRANYEKKNLSRNETRYFTWTPGNQTVHASTDLQISCLTGGFENGRVNYDMNNAGCRALIGQD